ncbi:nucleolar protein 14 homolog [Lucilia sericata]|uniref:nucleolar protein 14 homolog n=1 Tax=Lucilia sericata TaxID=13632 RepID=UPI0018A80B83|nr:nucleolar protein 14 homolog [Lucilia sericata]
MVKKNKKSAADAVYAKKAVKKENPFATANPATSKRLNPFEVHMNKEKFQILGRTCKHDRGLPGVSRAKAVKRRQETLGQEFMDKHKTNKFKDRRIGKHLNDDQLDEQIMNARFAADKLERLKENKKSRFNLNDDEVLTHRGQTLEEIEQFRDERSDDEAEEDEGLDAEFTEAAHFGGDDAAAKDRKSAIEEMIVEQKRRKIEIAKEKDELFDLTEKLDANYKDLMGLVGKMSKNELKAKPDPDDYDRLTKELVFEPRGVVSDKLLSEEDLAKKEKERLEKLERERMKRMRAEGEEDEEEQKPKHRSADDLDDGYFAYGDGEEEGTLAYNMDGTLGGKQEDNEENGVAEEEHGAVEEEENDDGNDEDEEEDEEEDDEEESEDEDDEEDHLSDLKVSDSEEENDEEVPTKVAKEKVTNKQKQQETKVNIERTDLPFTIEMPKSYSEFTKLLNEYKLQDQAIIIERLIKCNHPKLEGVNREKIVKLFAFLLQLLNEKFSDASQEDIRTHFQFLSSIMPHLYDLIHLNPERMSNTLLDVIKEKYAEFKKNSKQFPSLEVLIYLKLVSNLCSTSDFRHPIVTPCYIFIQHILSKARVRSRQDIAMGLFLVTLSLEYGQISKRFLPAAFNYLLGVVFLSIPKRPIEIIKILPPFQSQGLLSKLLAIPEDSKDFLDIKEEPLKAEDLVTQTFSNDFKVRSLNQCLKLIEDAVSLVNENIGSNFLATSLLDMLEKLPLTAYPTYVKDNYEKTKTALESLAKKTLTKLVPPEKKPKALRLLEPRIETVYDDKRRPKLSAAKEEKVKLMAKIKRETKGAIREIRRDTEFLQKMRISQQLQSDKERREKVKRIYAEASLQQGELNAMDRAKKKKKF